MSCFCADGTNRRPNLIWLASIAEVLSVAREHFPHRPLLCHVDGHRLEFSVLVAFATWAACPFVRCHIASFSLTNN